MLSCASAAFSAQGRQLKSVAMPGRSARKRPASARKRPASARKRPAAHAMLRPDAEASRLSPLAKKREEMLGELPSEQPDWEKHVVEMFDGELGFIINTLGIKAITLNLWCDCAGLLVEGFALDRLAKRLKEHTSLEVGVKVFTACEIKGDLRSFIADNHHPKHMCNDILNRDWVRGRFECGKTDQWLDFPSVGIDLYVAGFPCGPWTTNGLRKGLGDPNAQQCFATVKTIKLLQPCLHMLENVMECTRAHSGEDFKTILNFLNSELPNYAHNANLAIDPTQRAYPIFRTRVLIEGGNGAKVKQELLVEYVGRVLSKPFPLTMTYWDFLRLKERLELQRMHMPPNPHEISAILGSGCTCGLDPMTLCEVHVCKCKCCQKQVGLNCEWRLKAKTYIDNNLKNMEQHMLEEITYLQAIELFSVIDCRGPSSPRERNMLNIMARKPNLQPLSKSFAVMDTSASIDHASINASGAVPTLGVNATPWVFALGRFLTVYQMGMLMGHNMAEIKLDALSDNAWRSALGNSLHVATTGSMLFPMIMAALVGHNQQP